MEHRRGVIVTCAIAIILSVAETEQNIGWEGITIPSNIAWWFLLAAHSYNLSMWFWVSGETIDGGSLKGIISYLYHGFWLPDRNPKRKLILRVNLFLRYGLPTWAAFVGLTISLWFSISQLQCFQ